MQSKNNRGTNMNLNIVLIVAFIVALAFIISALYFSFRQRRISLSERKITVRPFWIIVIGFFIAGVAMYYPVYLTNYFTGEQNFLTAIKALCLSLHNTMRLFILDGEFDALRDLVTSEGVYKWLEISYSVFGCAMFVVAPVLTAGFVLSFFKNATAYLKYTFYNGPAVYYLSELNDRSLTLAEDIINNVKGKKLVVFFGINDTDESNDEMVFRAKSAGAICLKKELSEIGLKHGKILRKFFIISEDEDKNVELSLELIDKCRKHQKYNTAETQFYVYSKKPGTEILLSAADHGNMKLRRVVESKNLAYRTLRAHSVFDDAAAANTKHLNIVIVGAGKYGTEFLKTLCWYTQMVGYTVEIHAFDNNQGIEERLASSAPELVKFNGVEQLGEGYYKIIFHEGIDIGSEKFMRELSSIGQVTTAFATVGDDNMNIQASICMREVFGRVAIEKGYVIPPILASVRSHKKNEIFYINEGLKSLSGKNYGIEFIGDARELFSLETVEQTELEEKGLACHLRWSTTAEEIEKSTALYDKHEYYRRASVAEALYSERRVQLGIITGKDSQTDEIIKEYEHRRWNVFMRAEGYVYAPVRDEIAKTHPSLIPYQDLSKKEKKKDEVVLKAREEKNVK